MLELADILAHLDRILEHTRSVEGVFKSVSEAETFSERIRTLRTTLDKANTARPTFDLIATTGFPSLAGKSLRVSFAKFAKQLKQVAEKSGSRFALIKPGDLNLATSEVHCHFEGTRLPRNPKIAETAHRSVADIQRLKPIEPLIAALRGSDLEEIASSLTDKDARGRVRVKFFVSYTRIDAAQVNRLLEKLRLDLTNSKRFAFEFWQDTQILLCDRWHDSILAALENCDFGLALISPGFFANEYIIKHEFPALVSGAKPLIAVEVERLNYTLHDLFGLEERQVFKLEESGRNRCFAECTGQVASRFVSALAAKIEDRVEASLRERAQIHVFSALGDPAQLDRLAAAFPRLRELIAEAVGSVEDGEDAAPRAPAVLPSPPEAASREKFRGILYRQVSPAKLQFLVESACAAMGLEEVEQMLDKSPHITGEPDPYQRFRTHQRKAVDFLRDWLRNPEQPPFAAVLGEIGSGKTTMLQMLAHAVASDAEAPPVIFVDLRDYQKSGDATLEAILAEHLRRHGGDSGLKPDDILRAVRHDLGLIIFDGLDEKIIPMSDGARQAFVRELWRVLPADIMDRPAVEGRGRLIISCRSHYFPTVQAQSSGYLGQDRSSVSASDYVACIMLPWQKEQIEKYLAGVLGQDRVRVALEVIATVHNLRDLAQRPYLLSLIAPELESLERDRAQGRSVNAAALYTKFTERWLHRDDGKHVFTQEHKRLLMEQLAADLWRENAREWPWDRVTSWLDQFLHDHPVLAGRYSRDHVTANALNQDFRTATFFLRPDASNNDFRFAHTSLQEYFLAAHLAHTLVTTQAASAWDLPMPSLETFDFTGQLIETLSPANRDRALAGLRRLLENADSPARSRLAAFAFLIRAAKQDLPIPETVAIQARDLDLTAWDIASVPDRLLRLAGADFSMATLIRTKFRYVDLNGSRWHDADLCSAEFINCKLENAEFVGDEKSRLRLQGTRLHGCSLTGAAIVATHRAGLRVDMPVWDATTRNRWHASLNVEYACLIAPLVPLDPLPTPPEACWSLGHIGTVNAVAFSSDGRIILSGSDDNTVRIWETHSFACLRVLEGHSRAVNAVAFSGDGQRILSGSDDGTIKVWDAVTGVCLRALEVRSHTSAVAFSSEGHRILSADVCTVRVWDAVTGACLLSLKSHSRVVVSMAFSSDGQRIVSADEKAINIWDAHSGVCVRVLKGQSGALRSVAFSGDGQRILSGSADGTVRVWDAVNGVCLRVLEGHSLPVTSVAFSGDGQRILSGSNDGTARVWDASTGVCLSVVEILSRMGKSVAFSSDGQRILSGSNDGIVRVFDAVAGVCICVSEAHSPPIFRVAISNDRKRILSWSLDHTIRAWDAHGGVPLKVTKSDLQWLQNNGKQVDRNVAVSKLGTVRYKCSDGTEFDIATLPEHGYIVLQKPPQHPGNQQVTRMRVIYGTAETWRYVNYATDEGSRVLWSADLLGPIRLG